MRVDNILGNALTTVLSASETPLSPSTLLAIAAEAIGASHCELQLGTKTFLWNARDTAPDAAIATLALSTDPDIVVTVSPAAVMPTSEAWQPLVLLLTPYAAEEALRHARRRRQEAEWRIDDVRWRASADMEHERRRLERDLHDGAQHHLVALRMAIAFADHAHGKPGGDARLAALRDQLDEAERLLLTTARGVLPEVLARSGLRGALLALEGTDVEIHADISRLMPDVESALYYLALEAVGNARRHAPGARIVVEARLDGGVASLQIRDDGPGFVVGQDVGGLAYLGDRTEAIGGTFEVESSPGAGTRVSALVPY